LTLLWKSLLSLLLPAPWSAVSRLGISTNRINDIGIRADSLRETGRGKQGKQGSAHGFLPTHPKQELKSVATGAAPAAPVLFLLHSLAQKTGEFHEHHYI